MLIFIGAVFQLDINELDYQLAYFAIFVEAPIYRVRAIAEPRLEDWYMVLSSWYLPV